MKKAVALFVFMLCLLSLCAAGAEENAALYSAQGENGKMGYINRAGEWVIAPQFDSAGDFRGNYASVAIYPADYDPETDDDDPFRELHPDLEDAPSAARPPRSA